MKSFMVYAVLVCALVGMAAIIIHPINAADIEYGKFPRSTYQGQFSDSIGIDSVTAAVWTARIADTTNALTLPSHYSKGRLWVVAAGDTFHTYIQYSYDGVTWTTKDTVKVAKANQNATVVIDSTYTPLTGFKLGKVYPYYRVIFKQGTTGHHGGGAARTTCAGKIKNWIITFVGWD